MKLLALDADFSSLSTDPLSSRKPMQASVKVRESAGPHRKWLFFAIGSSSVKTVADRHRHRPTAHHNKH